MKSRYIVLCAVFVLIVGMAGLSFAETFGQKKSRIRPEEYGNIVMDLNSSRKDMAPVVYKHWVHRTKFTCRVCHVDVGFAMKAGDSHITCDDIKGGLYCGSCHDGKTAFGRIGRDENGKEVRNCDRCHSYGRQVQFKYDFFKVREPLPKERFGNGINWQKAEEDGLIAPKDFLEGVSVKRKKIKDPKDIELSVGQRGMPDIIFSHVKHAVWNGCETCHPEIFGVKKGVTVYNMQDIFDGKYCGACHDKVAFSNHDCQRCHTREVF